MQLRRSTALGLVLAMACASPAFAAAPSGRFVDDDGHPAEVALEWLAAAGVIDGCDPPANSRSCPDGEVTRAQAAKIIVQLADAVGATLDGAATGADSFIDDDDALGGGGEVFIERLVAGGALHGCDPPSNRRVCPDGLVTRGQAAKILTSVFGLRGVEDPAAWPDTSGWFYAEAASTARQAGLWTERAAFDGQEPLTRGELAVVSLLAAGTRLCRPTPFTEARIDELTRRYPSRSLTAHVYDVRTGCHYRLNPTNRQRTASVFKVMVMAGALLEAQEDDRRPSDWEWSQLDPMITESANGPVRALWYSYGASPWFARQGAVFGLGETTVRGDDGSAWGLTTTSASDQVDLLRQVLLGQWGPLEQEYRADALALMDDVVASQTWGITAGVPDGWLVAQKNGFAGITINSVGWVREPGEDGYVVAILGQGWPDHPTGIEAAERISTWVSEAMTSPWTSADPLEG